MYKRDSAIILRRSHDIALIYIVIFQSIIIDIQFKNTNKRSNRTSIVNAVIHRPKPLIYKAFHRHPIRTLAP